MSKLWSISILLMVEDSSSYMNTLNFCPPSPQMPPVQPLQLLNIAVCGWLHVQQHTPVYLRISVTEWSSPGSCYVHTTYFQPRRRVNQTVRDKQR